jgi:putative ABC transport system ATP-binding protein
MRLLRRTAIFGEISEALVSFLLARVHYEAYAPGQTVIRQGDIGDRFYMIKRGRAEAVVEKPGESPRRFELKAGDYFGEIALLMDIPRTATVRALEALEVGALDKAAFLSLRSGSRQLQESLDSVLAERVRLQEQTRP